MRISTQHLSDISDHEEKYQLSRITYLRYAETNGKKFIQDAIYSGDFWCNLPTAKYLM